MHGKILLKQNVLVEKKTARTVLDQKCFCNILIKFYWKKCVLVNILIWAWKHCTKTKCFWLKFFIKFYWKKCVSVNILICTWKISTKTKCFNRKKRARTVLDQKCFCHFFIKFYSNKCVSFNILICTWQISTETKCFNRKKGQERCLIKSVSVTFL